MVHNVIRRAAVAAGAAVVVLGSAVWAAGPAGAGTNPACPGASSSTATSCTYAWTGGNQYFTVPAGVTSLDVTAVGAAGGYSNIVPPPWVCDLSEGLSGPGASVEDTAVPVTPGQTLTVVVGGVGGNGGQQDAGGHYVAAAGGTPGNGGAGGSTGSSGTDPCGGGGGGGFSGLVDSSGAPLVIAAGGGGGGNNSSGGAGDIGDGNGGADGTPLSTSTSCNSVNESCGEGGFGATVTAAGAAGIACLGGGICGGFSGTAGETWASGQGAGGDGGSGGAGGGGGGGGYNGGGGGGGDGSGDGPTAGGGGGGASFGAGPGLSNGSVASLTTPASVSFTFTYSAVAPVVTGVSLASGPLAGGTTVTITGSGLTGATGVSFGGTAATSFTVTSDTSITATAPAGTSAGPVDVTVTTPAGTSNTGPADQYSYIYQFSGFTAPVASPPTLNQVHAGQAIPIQFRLGGNFGTGILAAGSPTVTQVNCSTSAPVNTGTMTDTAGGSGLQYDSTTGNYTYVWKTSKAWAGTCEKFNITLNDGTSHTAVFQFG